MTTEEKLIRFTELCCISRHVGITLELGREKIALANELVNDGVLTNDKMYEFVDKEIGNRFRKTVDEWKEN